MLSIQNITMRFGNKILFENVTTTFMPQRRYGLTGPNGSGKSTFINILTRQIEPTNGNIRAPRKVGVLNQNHFAFDNNCVIDTVIMGNKFLWQAFEERERLYNKPNLTDNDGIRLGEIENIIADENGYTAENDAKALLNGLDIPQNLHRSSMKELQGGQKIRVLLAQALFGNPEALLLDEPTNHLDLESIHWLESFLIQYQGIVIVISHDHHFLNSVCTHIADIDYQTIIQYTGGYDEMILQKTQIRSKLEAENSIREKKIAQLEDFIQRFAAGTRSTQVQSRRKEVERLTPKDLIKSNIQRPYIKFNPMRQGGKHALEFNKICKNYFTNNEKLEIIKNYTANVLRGEKIAIVGRNGVGKSTLIKSLLANVKNINTINYTLDSGDVTWGYDINIGYFPQDFKEFIPKNTTLVDWLQTNNENLPIEEIRGILGQMLFRGTDGVKKTDFLSGGETCRLILCKLMLQKSNFLILDEPTNHLDLETVIALTKALKQYNGTIILVTHDEDLIDEVATRIWHLDNNQLYDFHGTYKEFLINKTNKQINNKPIKNFK